MKVSAGTKGNRPTLASEAAGHCGEPVVRQGHSQGYLWQLLFFNQEWVEVTEVALLVTLYLGEQMYSPCNVFLLLVIEPLYSFTLGGGGTGCTPEPSPYSESTPADVPIQNYSFSGNQLFSQNFSILEFNGNYFKVYLPIQK